MAKIESYEALKKLKDIYKKEIDQRSNPSYEANLIQIKVGMGTSGIASGAKQVFDFMKEALIKRNINAVITKVGDMGYCFAEPTIEVIVPGKKPVIFGDVTLRKADDIIEKYIKSGEEVEGIIEINFQKIN
ncbi:MAG: (2Fe-2S) ferredoxin domain-containing protein [Bacteroidales bacterium]|nr:(2Fe-2S) ferredoxin domain-containing protein [Bacteroidales bacterium]